MTPDARLAVLLIVGALTCLSLSRAAPKPNPTTAGVTAPALTAQATALRDGTLIDPNLATAGDLDLLPGVGPSLAARIVAARSEGGRFEKREDLLRVRGIGRKALAKLAPFLRFGPLSPEHAKP